MMKRIISAILSISILISFAITETVMAKTNLSAKAEVLLKALEIIDEDEDLNAVVTRGRFTEMAGKIVLENIGESANYSSNFPDVGEYDEIYPYVSVLSSKGYVVGYTDGKFYPDNSLTAEHASKILINLLGLNFALQDNDSYMATAVKYGLFDDVAAGNHDSLTVADAAMLIYNALYSDAVNLTLSPNAQITFDGIYMEKKLNIFETSGIVTDNGKTSLSGLSSVDDGEIIVDDITMINESGNDNLLGRRIDGYYKYDKDDMTYTLIAADVTSSELNIEAQNINDYDNLTYYYLIDLHDISEKKVNLEKGFAVIYNGISVYDASVFDESKMQPEYGGITLINNDTDGKYDCLIIEDYKPVSIISVDSENYKIYGSKNEMYVLEEESSEITDVNGNKLTVSEIKINNIVSVYKSFDESFTRVIVSEKTVEGSINSINDEHVRINGGDYRYLTEIKDTFSIGSEGLFYLDHRNIIIVFEKILGAGNMYSFLYRAYMDDDEVSLNLCTYTQENRLRTFRAAQTVTVDGHKYREADYDELLAYLRDENGEIKKQLILMKLNSDGDVSAIDTAGRVESDDSLQIMPGADNEQLIFQVLAQTFAGKAMVDSETKVFLVPTEFDKGQIRVEDYKKLRNDSPYNVTAYSVKKGKLVADAVVIALDNTGVDVNHAYYSLEQLPFVVTDINTEANGNDEVVHRISMTNHVQSVDMYTTDLDVLTLERDDRAVTVSVGDVVRYGYNKDGFINNGNILLLYDEDCDYFVTEGLHAGSYESYRQAMRIRRAYIDKIENNNIRFKYEVSAAEADMDSYLLDNCKVLIFNRNRNVLTQGTVNDLIIGDDVVFYASSGRLSMAVIYR